MNKFHLAIISLLLFTQTNAQLLNEVGFFVGGTNYSGDIGNEAYIAPNKVGGSILYKRNINSRISLRGTFSYLPISDSDLKSSNVVRQLRGYSFSNTIYEIAVGMEFSYFDYDITSPSHTATPYILLEFAGFYYNVASSQINNSYNYASKVAYAIPFGLGFKSKLSRNFAYALEVRARYTFEDDLDYNNDRIYNLRFGNSNTNDWYFFTGLSVVYSFGRPPCAVSPQY
jgi:hypothetical protein